MSEKAFRIALPKLFLWSEPGRFQEYPEALSRAQAERSYTRVEVERELFDIAPTMHFQHGAPRGSRTDGIVNLYGMERSGDRWRLNGLGLLERQASRISATQDGLRLGAMYREHPQGEGWVEELARLVALREPRTRLVLWLMLRGAELVAGFSDSEAGSPLEVRLKDGGVLAIRWAGSDEVNVLLQKHAVELLGPFWTRQLGIAGSERVSWEGVVHGKEPSTNSLSTALRRSLGLFHHLDLFDGDQQGWVLDVEILARKLGDDVLSSLGIDAPRALPGDDDAFARALAETTDNDGFVIVSRLADRFGELLAVPGPERALVLDSFVRGAMYHERLRILERHSGQPRMGRGLFGENDSRRVRIEFHKGTSPGGSTPAAPPSVGHGRENSGGEQ